MNYDLVAGIFFGVGMCASAYLFYSVNRVRKIDLNLVTKTNDIDKEALREDINYIREDVNRMYSDIDLALSRIEALESKSKPKKKA